MRDEKMFSSPLHIKLRLNKNVVKVMNKNDEYGFRYIEKKIQKNGTFIGTQNAYNKGFSSKLNKTENNTFFKVCHSFLGVTKAHNQREII